MSTAWPGTGAVQTSFYNVITKVWTDGQQGENNDYFADHCDSVTVTIGMKGTSDNPRGDINQKFGAQFYLTSFTTAEKALLKRCLGDSDFDTSNNQDVYNWDKGTQYYPHIIKLVRTVTTYTDGGYYAAIWYDTAHTLDNLYYEGTFMLLNPFSPPDAFATDNYEIYTTKGTLGLVSNHSQTYFGFGSKYVYSVNSTYDTMSGISNTPNNFDGDVSCEYGNNNAEKKPYIFHCLNKTDIVTFLNWQHPEFNSPHINLYTITRLYKQTPKWSNWNRYGSTAALDNGPGIAMQFMTNIITLDMATNWGVDVGAKPTSLTVQVDVTPTWIYKFFPSTSSTYNYVAECSNRGLCDTSSGVCQCFPGYTSDSCHEQSSLAL